MRIARDAVYFEIGGYGGFYSMNYDRKFSDHLTARVGASELAFTNIDRERTHITTFPVGLGFLIDPENLAEGLSAWFGGADRYVEIGPGLVIGREGRAHESEPQDRSALVALTGTLGFRLQRREPGWILRMGVTPFLPLSSPSRTMFSGFSAGISAGYAF